MCKDDKHEQKPIRYRAFERACKTAEVQMDYFKFVLYLMQDNLVQSVNTREEKIAYIETRIKEKRGDSETLERILANLHEYGEVRRSLNEW